MARDPDGIERPADRSPYPGESGDDVVVLGTNTFTNCTFDGRPMGEVVAGFDPTALLTAGAPPTTPADVDPGVVEAWRRYVPDLRADEVARLLPILWRRRTQVAMLAQAYRAGLADGRGAR